VEFLIRTYLSKNTILYKYTIIHKFDSSIPIAHRAPFA